MVVLATNFEVNCYTAIASRTRRNLKFALTYFLKEIILNSFTMLPLAILSHFSITIKINGNLKVR